MEDLYNTPDRLICLVLFLPRNLDNPLASNPSLARASERL